MTSDGEMTKIRDVDLKKLQNFVVDIFFIWIRLVSQMLILKPDEDRMGRMNIRNGQVSYRWSG
jgi:hypothetical protein